MYLLGKVQPQVKRTWSWKVTSEIAFHFFNNFEKGRPHVVNEWYEIDRLIDYLFPVN